MIVSPSEEQKRLARRPHNLFVLNVLLFNLMLAPAAIVLDIGMFGMLLPLGCSLSVIAWLNYRAGRSGDWFVDMHWRLAVRRSLWLLAGYALSGTILFVAWLIALASDDPRMAGIMFTAISRVALLPTLLALMVTVVLEAGGFHLINRGEVPDWLAQRYPADPVAGKSP